MAGNGGYKQRKRRVDRQRTARILKAKESIRRVRNEFESKGQAWEPADNPAQMAKLNHAARRLISRSSYADF